ncbi:NAD(P)/FAD-dependent oxidoreductase [Actinomadura rubrisoli]|uniref:NAD(P)/FAD-dependent oxidoreductase n=1 Tax=Actinomadura rubrisoli TaxID=2530368 RepID=UPI001FB68BC3|nr:FAD-dependent oxidoreductase [Actinomadura rubrisoli]
MIGAGVAGLTAAYLLQRRYEVTLFEAEPRAGGHAHTHDVPAPGGGSIPVDTGFMVFNRRNYPHLVCLLDELGVRTRGSDMSMSLTCEQCSMAYLTGSALRGLPVRPAALSASAWRALGAEMKTFTRLAAGSLDEPVEPTVTVGDLLEEHGFSVTFAEHLVLPLVSALWSCGSAAARQYPAHYLFRFLDNHGLLPGGPPTRWRTVVGGSREYVRRITTRLPTVHCGRPAQVIRRLGERIEVRDAADEVHTFDRAVVAVHSDQALRLLADATAQESSLLGAIPYVANETVLHTDAALLPDEPRMRASWNVRRVPGAAADSHVLISYHLNRLQGIAGPVDYVVTLNPAGRVREDRTLARMVYEHPVHTPRSVDARCRLPSLNSPRLAFAGAYHGWAFHEDGCASGVRAAGALGATWS